jgi:signal transduction histidine kinase
MSGRWWPGSIRTRLLLVMVGGLLLALVAGSVIFWWDRGRFARQMNVDHYVDRVAAAVRLLDDEQGVHRDDALRVMQTPVFRVEVLPSFPARDEIRIAETPLSREVEALLQERLDGRDVLFRQAAMPRHDHWPPRHGFMHRHFNEPPRGYVAVVALGDDSAVRVTYRLPGGPGRWPSRLLVSTLILILSAVFLSVLAVRLVVRPLRDVAGQAEQIGRDLQTPEMPETGPSEVRRVALAMNSMQRKIRQLFEQRSRFLAAVSHDLRTPITRMRLRAELIDDDELRKRMERDLAEMERMVQQTLEFMRDGDSREAPGKIDLNALLDALVEDIAEQGREVVFEPVGRPVIESRPLALKRCIGNLLSNALRHGVKVELRVMPSAPGISIEVLDDGPGIPEDELEHVFEAFYRLDKSRSDSGTGLGLSIARAIAESLGGSLTLKNRDSGGLVARLVLPGEAP